MIKTCRCDEYTTPRDLCAECNARRQRIKSRLRKRKDRERYPAGAALLTSAEVHQLHETLAALNDLQLAIVDRLAQQGQHPRGDTLTLFQHLAAVRATLTPHLTNSREELLEAGRPTTFQEAQRRRANPTGSPPPGPSQPTATPPP